MNSAPRMRYLHRSIIGLLPLVLNISVSGSSLAQHLAPVGMVSVTNRARAVEMAPRLGSEERSRTDGAASGALLGAALGAVAGLILDRQDHTGEGFNVTFMMGGGALAGAVLGALLGALVPR